MVHSKFWQTYSDAAKEFPELSTRVRMAIWRRGIHTRAEAARRPNVELRDLYMVGPGVVRELRQAIPYEPAPDLTPLRLAVVETAKAWRKAELAYEAAADEDVKFELGTQYGVAEFDFEAAIDALLAAETP